MSNDHQAAIEQVHKACQGIRGEFLSSPIDTEKAVDQMFKAGEKYDADLIQQLHANGLYRSKEVIGYEKRLLDLANKKSEAQSPDSDGIDNDAVRDEIKEALADLHHEKYCVSLDDEIIIFDNDDKDYTFFQSLSSITEESYLLDVLADVSIGLGGPEDP